MLRKIKKLLEGFIVGTALIIYIALLLMWIVLFCQGYSDVSQCVAILLFLMSSWGLIIITQCSDDELETFLVGYALIICIAFLLTTITSPLAFGGSL